MLAAALVGGAIVVPVARASASPTLPPVTASPTLPPATAAPSRPPRARTAPTRRPAPNTAVTGTPVPYMGVDTWYAFGRNIDQAVVVGLANAVVKRGLKAAGYRYIWIDSGWWNGARDGLGQMIVDSRQWPRGMKWLVQYIHSKGLLAGIYTDAGKVGCAGGGSYGHYQGDVDTFASWGFDAVKVDFCGGHAMHLNARVAYHRFDSAIEHDRPHRPMTFAIADGVVTSASIHRAPIYARPAYAFYRFAPAIAASWRTGPDLGWPGHVEFDWVLRNIALDARHPQVAGNGHWNDPDYLVPDQGMTPGEARAQFTMWVMLAAPLVLSDDVSTMSEQMVRILTDGQAITINQDPLGIQGHKVHRERSVEVWVKPLVGGAQAVAFLNQGSRHVAARATPAMLGITRRQTVLVQDVWNHWSGRMAGPIPVVVPAHGAVLLRVAAHPSRSK